jgi:predicted ester cyclase
MRLPAGSWHSKHTTVIAQDGRAIQEVVMSEENKAIVRRFYEIFGADLDALKEVLASDLVAYSHAKPGPQNLEEHLQGIGMWNESFETRFDIEEQLAEGDRVATRVTMRAVHNGGEFMGVPPSGKEIVTTGISFERIKDGQIVHRRVESDWLGVMQHLGLIPPPG